MSDVKFVRDGKDLVGVIFGIIVLIDYHDVNRDDADKAARLIESAPALLAALTDLLAFCGDVSKDEPTNWTRAVLRAQAALASAGDTKEGT